MMRKGIALLTVCLLLWGRAAWAHRIDEYLQATILSLEMGRAHASMRLIPGVMIAPTVIAAIDSDHDGVFSEDEKQQYANRILADLTLTVDGRAVQAQLDSWVVPDAAQLRDGLGEIAVKYHVDLPTGGGPNRNLVLANHHLNASSVYLMNVEVPQDRELRIVDQKRNQQQSIYEVDYQQLGKTDAGSAPASTLGEWLKGLQFSSLFRLGMRHIAEGTDHLLFLLALLLPAPLLAVDTRWSVPAGVRQSLVHLLGIVTAFTIGHSLTLTLAAMNFIHVPSRPVEVLIGVSILISAVHALRPLFPGREAWIAAFFGLIHGLAFASTLDRLGLARWDRLAGILAFNVGIETMQLLVVAAVLPSLLILSRTDFYSILRIAGALAAGAASITWIYERGFNVQTSVDAMIDSLAQRGLWGAAFLLITSVVCFFYGRLQHRQANAAVR